MTKLYKKQINFTQISNELICNPKISCKAKAIYCYLYSRPEGWEFYLGEIKKHFQESIDIIRNALKELENNQYIIKKQLHKDNGKFGGSDIEIIYKEDLPHTENTDTDETAYGKSDPNNTNISNTDIISNTNNNISKEKDPFILSISNSLKDFLISKKKVNITNSQLNGWYEDIRKLKDIDLKLRDNAEQDIITCMQSVFDNTGADYFPIIESGKSFREKFSKIENFNKRNKKSQGRGNLDITMNDL